MQRMQLMNGKRASLSIAFGCFGRGLAARSIAALTAVAFTGLVAHGPAIAAAPTSVKRVALFVMPKTKASATDAQVLQSFMRAELRKLVGVVSVAGQAEPPAPVKALVLPSIETGFRSLNERNPAAAQEAFEKAYRDITQYKGPVDKRLIARVLKGLGASQVMNGLPEGSETLDTSLNVWPNQQISDYSWTLDLRTAFNELINRRSQLAPGSVDIDTEPGGAAVRIDGELKGFSPVEVKDLTAGKHWIETSIDGYRWTAMFVEVPAGESAIHSVELEPTPNKGAFDSALKALERGLPKGAVANPMSDLGRIATADAVIALEVSNAQGGYALSGFVRDGGELKKISTVVPQDGSMPENLRKFLASALGVQTAADDSELPLDGPPQAAVFTEGDIIIDPDDPIFAEKKKKDEDPVTSEWWFWALVGGVTAGLVVGGVALFGSQDAGSGPAGNVVLSVNRLP